MIKSSQMAMGKKSEAFVACQAGSVEFPGRESIGDRYAGKDAIRGYIVVLCLLTIKLYKVQQRLHITAPWSVHHHLPPHLHRRYCRADPASE